MKIIIREEIANKLYKILKKADSKEIKGACFAKIFENSKEMCPVCADQGRGSAPHADVSWCKGGAI